MSNSIKLSKKHGVNPTIPKCFVCNEDKNEIILMGRLKDDAEAPKNVCFDNEPCNKCKEHMRKGIIMISVKDGEKDTDNPYRTGGWIVLKEDAFPNMSEEIKRVRMCFVPDSVWDELNLPRGENINIL